MGFLSAMKLKRELRREQKASLRVERQARAQQANKLKLERLQKERAVAEGREAIRQEKKKLRELNYKKYIEAFGNIKKGVQKLRVNIDENKKRQEKKVKSSGYDPYEVKKMF